MDILGPGDTSKLLWEVMALIEEAEQKKSLSPLKDRYILAYKAGFELRSERPIWLVNQARR